MTLTPADHRARAITALDQLRTHGPGTASYHSLVLTAIAHALVAVAGYLEPPQIPGLPDGYRLDTRQDERGNHKWAYVLTPPGCPAIQTRYLYDTTETALIAGLRAARDDVRKAG